MSRPSLTTLVVASLAAHRAARLVAVDQISAPLRDKLGDWLDKPVMRRLPVAGHSRATDEVNVRATAVKEFAGELLECPHCLGVWFSTVALGAYTVARRRNLHWLAFAVEAAAVAGLQSTLASGQAALDTIGQIDADDVNEANEAETR